MTPEEEQALKQKVSELEARLNKFDRGDRYRFWQRNIEMDKDVGTKIGTDTKQKIGFWTRAPTVQFNSTGELAGHNGHGGTAVTHSDDWYGGTDFGSGNRYTINDIVKALKTCGILAP